MQSLVSTVTEARRLEQMLASLDPTTPDKETDRERFWRAGRPKKQRGPKKRVLIRNCGEVTLVAIEEAVAGMSVADFSEALRYQAALGEVLNARRAVMRNEAQNLLSALDAA